MDILQLAQMYALADIDQQYKNGYTLIRCPHPLHEDQHPSCRIKKNYFRCYGCSACGTVEIFAAMIAAKIQGTVEIDELEGLMLLAKAKINHIQEKSEEIVQHIQVFPHYREKRRAEAEFFIENLPQIDWQQRRQPYLFQKRKFTAETLTHFRVLLNFSSHFPLVFPIYQDWQMQGYIARVAKDVEKKEMRYMFNDGFIKHQVVGLAEEYITQDMPLLVVEGWLDMMKAWQHGYTNAACIFGWSISRDQLAYIQAHASSLLVATDQDEAGRNGYEKIRKETSLPVYRFLSQEKDIGDIHEKSKFWQYVHLALSERNSQWESSMTLLMR